MALAHPPLDDYIRATYTLDTVDLEAAAIAIARGQTVGNPTLQTPYETPEFLAKHEAAFQLHGQHRVTVYFHVANFAPTDGLNQLVCVLMGGQMDIGLIHGCVLEDLVLPASFAQRFAPPKYGVAGLRKLLGVYDRPLLCGIIKPKIGLTQPQHLTVCEQMIAGGCDVIKEDEIWGDLGRTWRRKNAIDLLKRYPHVLYLRTINGDRVDFYPTPQRLGLHRNVWCGFGSLRHIANSVSTPVMFQKSGDRLWTTGPYRLSETVWYQLIRLAGADIAHIGMVGGYLDEPLNRIQMRIDALRPAIPSFSCGMEPKLVKPIVYQFGQNVMLTSGGYIHSHPDGIVAGCRAMRAAIDATSMSNVKEGQ